MAETVKQPLAWLVKIRGKSGGLLDMRLEFTKPYIRSDLTAEFIPLIAMEEASEDRAQAVAPSSTIHDPLFGEVSEEDIRVVESHFSQGRSEGRS